MLNIQTILYNTSSLPTQGSMSDSPLYATIDIHQGQELAGGRTIGPPVKLLRIGTFRANRIERGPSMR